MKVLVTGGAGYIGSHTCKELAREGHTPIVVDNFVYGHEWAIKWGPFFKLDILDTENLTQIIKTEKPEAIIHFAAYAYVGESVKDPLKYYQNNVVGSMSILKAMKETGLDRIVFSSTCATYGIPQEIPIHEELPQYPVNPYGQTKLHVENLLRDFGNAYGIKSVALRYFNAAGADADGEIGESHDPETHLIPLTLLAAKDASKPLTVMGTDYPTPDGTCIRDYIHVTDLASAHVASLGFMESPADKFSYFNLGTGHGVSVKEIIAAAEKVTGKKVAHSYGARRPGDPPSLVAKAAKANKILKWMPKYSSIENILSTAHVWHEKSR